MFLYFAISGCLKRIRGYGFALHLVGHWVCCAVLFCDIQQLNFESRAMSWFVPPARRTPHLSIRLTLLRFIISGQKNVCTESQGLPKWRTICLGERVARRVQGISINSFQPTTYKKFLRLSSICTMCTTTKQMITSLTKWQSKYRNQQQVNLSGNEGTPTQSSSHRKTMDNPITI